MDLRWELTQGLDLDWARQEGDESLSGRNVRTNAGPSSRSARGMFFEMALVAEHFAIEQGMIRRATAVATIQAQPGR
jgi:hypothetical protein